MDKYIYAYVYVVLLTKLAQLHFNALTFWVLCSFKIDRSQIKPKCIREQMYAKLVLFHSLPVEVSHIVGVNQHGDVYLWPMTIPLQKSTARYVVYARKTIEIHQSELKIWDIWPNLFIPG